MANTNKPYGLRLMKTEGKEFRVRRYPKTAAAIYEGDAVMQDATGAVKVATAAVALMGVAAEYRAASAADIAIIDDPEATFSIQASANLAAADILLNADIVANAADSTLLQSKHALDSESLDTTATLQLKVLGFVQDIENSAAGSYARVEVKINNHIQKGGTGTAGI